MASLKISELNELVDSESTDLIPIVYESANETKKIKTVNLIKGSYSTNEVKTNNTWIDGKPIYRKTIFISNLSQPTVSSGNSIPAYNDFATGVSNIEDIIDMRGMLKQTGVERPHIYPLNYTQITSVLGSSYSPTISRYSWWTYYNRTNNSIRVSNLYVGETANLEGYVTIEYTKTTD